MADASAAALEARGLSLSYDRRTVIEALELAVPVDSFTVIVGPNACGKSTLLRGMAQLLRPTAGEVLIDGTAIATLRTKEVALRLGLLPQSATAPDGITVFDLVARGRYPHQSFLGRWSDADEQAVGEAMAATRVVDLADRPVDELSGGQRQRVWVAMALAQQTPLLLLDEPTTFLDIAHQYELMELFAALHRQGRTLVAVLHDLVQAARYATHLVVMANGRIVAQGDPGEILDAELVESTYGLPCRVIPDPVVGTPMIVPDPGRLLRP